MKSNQVAFIGLNNVFGRIVSSLLKQSPNINKLVLYDDRNGAKSYINGTEENCNVTTVYGREKLPEALSNADVVIIGDELFQKPNPEDIPVIGQKAAEYAKLIAESSPNAFVVIAASPLNYVLPIFARVLEAAGCFNPRKVLGATSCDTLRASSLLSARLRIKSQTILPVVGGGSASTRIPLFSQANYSPIKIDQETQLDIIRKLKEFEGSEYTERNIMERAYASVRFANSVLAARKSQNPIPEIALTRNNEIPEVEYFSMPLLIGKEGVEKIMKLPKLSSLEKEILNSALTNLKVDIELSKNILEKKKPQSFQNYEEIDLLTSNPVIEKENVKTFIKPKLDPIPLNKYRRRRRRIKKRKKKPNKSIRKMKKDHEPESGRENLTTPVVQNEKLEEMSKSFEIKLNEVFPPPSEIVKVKKVEENAKIPDSDLVKELNVSEILDSTEAILKKENIVKKSQNAKIKIKEKLDRRKTEISSKLKNISMAAPRKFLMKNPKSKGIKINKNENLGKNIEMKNRKSRELITKLNIKKPKNKDTIKTLENKEADKVPKLEEKASKDPTLETLALKDGLTIPKYEENDEILKIKQVKENLKPEVEEKASKDPKLEKLELKDELSIPKYEEDEEILKIKTLKTHQKSEFEEKVSNDPKLEKFKLNDELKIPKYEESDEILKIKKLKTHQIKPELEEKASKDPQLEIQDELTIPKYEENEEILKFKMLKTSKINPEVEEKAPEDPKSENLELKDEFAIPKYGEDEKILEAKLVKKQLKPDLDKKAPNDAKLERLEFKDELAIPKNEEKEGIRKIIKLKNHKKSELEEKALKDAKLELKDELKIPQYEEEEEILKIKQVKKHQIKPELEEKAPKDAKLEKLELKDELTIPKYEENEGILTIKKLKTHQKSKIKQVKNHLKPHLEQKAPKEAKLVKLILKDEHSIPKYEENVDILKIKNQKSHLKPELEEKVPMDAKLEIKPEDEIIQKLENEEALKTKKLKTHDNSVLEEKAHKDTHLGKLEMKDKLINQELEDRADILKNKNLNTDKKPELDEKSSHVAKLETKETKDQPIIQKFKKSEQKKLTHELKRKLEEKLEKSNIAIQQKLETKKSTDTIKKLDGKMEEEKLDKLESKIYENVKKLGTEEKLETVKSPHNVKKLEIQKEIEKLESAKTVKEMVQKLDKKLKSTNEKKLETNEIAEENVLEINKSEQLDKEVTKKKPKQQNLSSETNEQIRKAEKLENETQKEKLETKSETKLDEVEVSNLEKSEAKKDSKEAIKVAVNDTLVPKKHPENLKIKSQRLNLKKSNIKLNPLLKGIEKKVPHENKEIKLENFKEVKGVKDKREKIVVKKKIDKIPKMSFYKKDLRKNKSNTKENQKISKINEKEEEPKIIIKTIQKVEDIPEIPIEKDKNEKEFFDQKIDALVTILKKNQDEKGIERVINKIQTEFKKSPLTLFTENEIKEEENIKKSINPLGSWYEEEKKETKKEIKKEIKNEFKEPIKPKKKIIIKPVKSQINISFVDGMKKFRPQKKDDKMKKGFAMMNQNKKKVKKVLKLSLLGNKTKKREKTVSKAVPKKSPKRPYTPYGMNRKEKYHEMKTDKGVTVRTKKIQMEKKILNIGKLDNVPKVVKPEIKEEEIKMKLKEIRASIKAQNELKLIIKEKKSKPLKKGKKIQLSLKKDENLKVDEIKNERKVLKEKKEILEIKETKDISTQCNLSQVQKPPLKPKPVETKEPKPVEKIEKRTENVSPTRMLAEPVVKKPTRIWKEDAPSSIWGRIYGIVKQIITTDLREEEERRMSSLVHSKPPRT